MNWYNFSDTRSVFGWQGGKSGTWQIIGVFSVFWFIALLHLGNDGLWYQGDAPRHAANGLFWWDFLAHLPSRPVEFGLSYYARYPVITPATYPPFFYLLEGIGFKIFGPSPFVAKGLVLDFAFLSGLYTTLWLRRWVSEEAGWGGILLILQPGVIAWSHSITLNVPSMGLMIAGLYHVRRCLEDPGSRHFYAAVLFSLIGILTYYTTGVGLLVVLSWMIVEWQWRALQNRRFLILCLLSILLLLPCAVVVFPWAAKHVASIYPGNLYQIDNWNIWVYYFRSAKILFNPFILAIASASIACAMVDRQARREVKLLFLWVFWVYIAFSYLVEKEDRYIVVLAPPLVILCMITLTSIARIFGPYLRTRPSRLLWAGMGSLSLLHIWAAPLVYFPEVKGFREIVRFFEEVAPQERVLYDGVHNGVFSFYMRARDPEFKRGVVLGNKLVLLKMEDNDQPLGKRVASPADLIDMLKREIGCRWLAIENPEEPRLFPVTKAIREMIREPEFKWVRSFPVLAPGTHRVDVYRFELPVEQRNEQHLPFPRLGENTILHAVPIERTPKGFRY